MTIPTYLRGQVVFATPPKVNDDAVPITKTKSGDIGKHPVIILSTDPSQENITGVMVQSFGGSASLANTGLDATLYKWFLPISPASKESIHDPIPAQTGSSGEAEWVNLKDLMTISEAKIKKHLGDVPTSTLTAIEAARASVIDSESNASGA